MRTSILIALATALPGFTNAQDLIVQVKPADSDLWGYVNDKGETVVPPTYKHCYRFTESGYAAVRNNDTKTGAFIDAKGQMMPQEVGEFELIGGMFSTDVQGFSCGLAPVKVGEKWGFINTQGKLGIPAKYDKVDAFESCLSVVEVDKKKFILTADGKETPLADASIRDVKSFVDGLAPFVSKDKKEGFMNGEQKIVIPAQFLSVGYFSGDLAWAKTDDKKVGFIDKTGNWVVQPTFDAAGEFDPVSGLARVKKDGVFLYIDKAGKEMRVNDASSFGHFHEGLAEGKRGDLTGFYDKTGAWVIEPQFEGARKFHNGHASVKKGGMWGVVDTTGKWVLEPKYDGIKDMERVR